MRRKPDETEGRTGAQDGREYHDFSSFLGAYYRSLKKYLMTGLLVWVPLIVTIGVSWWVLSRVGFGIERLIRTAVDTLNQWGQDFAWLSFLQTLEYRRGMGFMLALALFLSTGLFARYLVAQKVIAAGENILSKIPFVSRIYVSAVQIRDVFTAREGGVFQQVVLVEYPRKGMVVIAFVTSREQGIVQEVLERPMVALFIPTTPNPTSGFLVYVRREEITPLNITVEDAMKMIISGGAYIPETAHLKVQQPAHGGPGKKSD